MSPSAPHAAIASPLPYRRYLATEVLLILTLLLPLIRCPLSRADTLSAAGRSGNVTINYLKGLSIEQLLQTRVTSVSKKSESLFDVAAAVTVITQEDIQRSGAHTIPDLLRMVPGLDVAQIDASRWAIGARGFNEYFESKLLVLIDGRSMYTPLYSGVFWNTIDTILPDIDRIEVIRGPGATVWGANAVNGVINIITKNSADTQGGLVSTVIGTNNQPMISTRYGSRINDHTTYRVYAKGFNRAKFDGLDGGDAHDAWQTGRTGFRVDSNTSGRDTVSLQGEVYTGHADLTSSLTGYLTPPYQRVTAQTEKYSGGHILSSWRHDFGKTSSTDLQMYIDHTSRDLYIAAEDRDTVDIDFKHHWDPAGRHDLVWGADLRWTSDDIQGTYLTSFTPSSQTNTLYSAFFQDDINLWPDTTWLTIGSKFEHYTSSGFDAQPSIRLRFKPTPTQLVWAAVSRAVRTPSRSERDITINLATMVDQSGNLSQLRLTGSKYFESEKLTAYELGYRQRIGDNLSIDLATYYQVYDDLRSIDTGTPFFENAPQPPHLVLPLSFGNAMHGISYGLETQITWQAADNLKLIGAYTFLDLDLDLESKDSVADQSQMDSESSAPRHQIQLRAYYDLAHNLSLDSALYYVSELGHGQIDPYVRFDLQLTWQVGNDLKLSLGGSNLFDDSHQEFLQASPTQSLHECPPNTG